jgi:hypothetical protein
MIDFRPSLQVLRLRTKPNENQKNLSRNNQQKNLQLIGLNSHLPSVVIIHHYRIKSQEFFLFCEPQKNNEGEEYANMKAD